MSQWRTQALTAAAFAPYGDVLEAVGAPDKIITQGMTSFNAVSWTEFFGLGQKMVNLAFLPLLFLPEGSGEFVRSLPAALRRARRKQ